MTQRLENSHSKEVLILLKRFCTPCQASKPADLTKGLAFPRESGLECQQDLITGLPGDWGKSDSSLGGTNKLLHAPRPRGEEQRPHRRMNQNYLLVVGQPPVETWVGRGSPQRQGHWKVPLGVKPLGSSPLSLPQRQLYTWTSPDG